MRADDIRPYGVGLGLCVICHLRRQCFQQPHNILDSLRRGRCPHRPVFKRADNIRPYGVGLGLCVICHLRRQCFQRPRNILDSLRRGRCPHRPVFKRADIIRPYGGVCECGRMISAPTMGVCGYGRMWASAPTVLVWVCASFAIYVVNVFNDRTIFSIRFVGVDAHIDPFSRHINK